MNLGLGTAQFGMNYGVSNVSGQTNLEEIKQILKFAKKEGIELLDTAVLYNYSEKNLGDALPELDNTFKIVTKTPKYSDTGLSIYHQNDLKENFCNSLKRLRVSSVYGLLLHDANNALVGGGELLLNTMYELKDKGLVKKIGVSVYNEHQIDAILEKYNIDLIQLPLNVFDQRLLLSGYIRKLYDLGIEIHVRSVFLQGLLLMPVENMPEYFDSIKEHLFAYHKLIENFGLSPLQAALGFISGIKDISYVICGVNNQVQLAEICKADKVIPEGIFAQFALEDEKFINPSLWKL